MNIEEAKLDKRKLNTPAKLEQLKRMRQLSQEKARQKKKDALEIEQEAAKLNYLDSIKEEEKEKEKIPMQPVTIEVPVPISVPREAPTKTNKKMSLTDDLREEIQEIVKNTISPPETPEQRKAKKWESRKEEFYNYILEKNQKPKAPEPSKQERNLLSLFD